MKQHKVLPAAQCEPQLAAALAEYARKTKRSKSAVIRLALEFFLTRETRKSGAVHTKNGK